MKTLINPIKLFAFLVFPLLFSTNIFAQDNIKKPYHERVFNIGLKAGINVNRLSTSVPDYFNNNYVGFKGGIFTRFNIKRFHFQPEVNFSMTGGTGRFQNNNSQFYNIKVNAIEVPLLLGFKIINFEIFNLRLNAGGFVNFNVQKSITVSDSNNPSNNDFTSAKMANFNGGVVVGLGMDIWRFTLDFRYQWGFVNVLGSNILVQDPAAKFRSGIFEFSVGFRLY